MGANAVPFPVLYLRGCKVALLRYANSAKEGGNLGYNSISC